MLNKIEIGKWTYRYLVGNHTVGIITPTRKKHHVNLSDIHGGNGMTRNGILNGMSDDRATPEQVAAYIIKNRLT